MARARVMTVFASVLAALIVAPGLFLFIGFATHREPYIEEDVGSVEALKAEFRDYPEVLFPDMSRYDGGEGSLAYILYENPKYRHGQYRIGGSWDFTGDKTDALTEFYYIDILCKEASKQSIFNIGSMIAVGKYGGKVTLYFECIDITELIVDNSTYPADVCVRQYFYGFEIDGYQYRIEGELIVANKDVGTEAEASRIAAAKEELIHIAESIISQKTGGGNA
jgi:hypothetical protein